MMKKLAAAILVGCCAAAMSGGHVQAIEVLGEIDKGSGVETIGSAPKKKKRKALELGKLRSGDATLPGDVMTREDRVRMRVKREAARQADRKDETRKAGQPKPRKGPKVMHKRRDDGQDMREARADGNGMTKRPEGGQGMREGRPGKRQPR